VIVPQKLFIMKTRNSFFPANTVCLTDVVSDYDDIQHTVHLQVGLHVSLSCSHHVHCTGRMHCTIDDLIWHLQCLCNRSSEQHL